MADINKLATKFAKALNKVSESYRNEEIDSVQLIKLEANVIRRFREIAERRGQKQTKTESPFRTDDTEEFIKITKSYCNHTGLELTKELVNELRPTYEETLVIVDGLKDLLKSFK